MQNSGARYLTAGIVATVCALATLKLFGVAEAATCAAAIERAAAKAGTPHSILQAIGTVESSGHPWAVNDAGRSYVFNSRAEAFAFLQERIEQGRRNLDIGCLQVNWRWHGDQLGSPEAALDPVSNALYAASYLRSLYDALGSWSAAVGAYHSRSPDRAEGYRCRVAKVLRPELSIVNCQ
ncbi:transglycosylase SLT domain-containing protein [Pelagibius marinus]|uniref:transglycosylase SLT domain-containing protein n=1 Tax=Pelagibius marinus TaxID=2762760 RepID=UPI001872DBA9|nr:transglycosylase SLT domain-containing protein [Pelagibius marinus]